jgi:hypothetical protein
MIDPAAPDGAPPRRINYQSSKRKSDPPCLGGPEAGFHHTIHEFSGIRRKNPEYQVNTR